MSLSTYYLEDGRHLARLHRRRRSRRRAYAPTSNTASHDNHEKVFSFLYGYGAPLGGPSGRRSSAIKGLPFLPKWYIKGKGWTSGRSLPLLIFFRYLPLLPRATQLFLEEGGGCTQASGLRAFSSPEPKILLACGRNRELWEQPFQACAIDEDCVKPDGQNSVISFVNFKMVALRALDSCRRPEGS